MDQHNNTDELKHYGVLGMKWGVRRATYKLRSSGGLKKSKKRVEDNIMKLEKKSNKQRAKAAKTQMKSAKAMERGDFKKAAEYMKKSSKQNKIAQKRDKTALHNKKLLKLYDKRISELSKESVDTGKAYIERKNKK